MKNIPTLALILASVSSLSFANSLETCEDKLSAGRNAYNKSVTDYVQAKKEGKESVEMQIQVLLNLSTLQDFSYECGLISKREYCAPVVDPTQTLTHAAVLAKLAELGEEYAQVRKSVFDESCAK